MQCRGTDWVMEPGSGGALLLNWEALGDVGIRLVAAPI